MAAPSDDYPRTGDLPTDGVPIRPAATLLLLDDRPDLHVLALRRTTRSTFVANHTLFPGGALDPDDHDPRWPDLVQGWTPADADEALGVDAGALAFWVAAVRETIEESGIAVGCTPDVVAHRTGLDAGTVHLSDLLANDGGLDLSGVWPVARWVTPAGGPKRYDTYFFAAAAPPGAEAVADGTEEGAPRRRARVLDESLDLVRFPGDPGYEAAGTREAYGWVWLPSGGASPED